MKVSLASPTVLFAVGEVFEFTETKANRLINQGYAEKVSDNSTTDVRTDKPNGSKRTSKKRGANSR